MPDVELINGDLPESTRHIDGVSLVIQRIRIRLGTHLGEWILDTAVGLPFIDQWTQIKPAPLDEIAAAIRLEVQSTPGVLRVEAVTPTFDVNLQSVRIELTAIVSDDQINADVAVQMAIDLDNNAAPHLTVINYPSRGIVP